ncbi:MAG: hypothetical protein AAB289_13900, partial [Chloroflexota bacterium]
MLDRHYVYFPAPWEPRDWAQASGLPLEGVWFRAGDGTRLFGWFLEAPGGDPSPVLIWAHGNAGNIIHRLDPLKGQVQERLPEIHIYPASHYVTPAEQLERALGTVQEELG